MSKLDHEGFIRYCQEIYGQAPIMLHRPVFGGNEKEYLSACIDSNFVSSIGQRVIDFEKSVADFTGMKYAVATVNGTAALHMCLKLAGVRRGDEVLTQSLTFVATCNALNYVGANPVFVDVDIDTMGLSAIALRLWLETNSEIRKSECFNRITGARISACMPMHTFGLPCRIREIKEVCAAFKIELIEDSAESLGSFVGDMHTGSFSKVSALSFNGNKIITTGGGGMIVTNDEELAVRAKHLTTTAKKAHKWEYSHDEVGYNHRLPNLNAALGCAQMEQLPEMLAEKKKVTEAYRDFFASTDAVLIEPIDGVTPNNWLNAIKLNSRQARDDFLEYTNAQGVMTRPIWDLMSNLEMFKNCQNDGLKNSLHLEQLVVNIPSSVPDGTLAALS
jgi:perosamine synthetase